MTTDTLQTRLTIDDSIRYLSIAGACATAQLWAIDNSHREGTTPEQLWNMCPRADWLLWLAGEAVVDAAHIGAALATLGLKDERPARMPWVTAAVKIEDEASDEYQRDLTMSPENLKNMKARGFKDAADRIRTVLPWGVIEEAMLEHPALDSQAARCRAVFDYNES